MNKQGVHYVLPVQAKGGKDWLGIIQIEQDIALCEARFPELICLSIAAQFITNEVIAMFQIEDTDEGIRVAFEKHYELVPWESVSDVDLRNYRKRLSE